MQTTEQKSMSWWCSKRVPCWETSPLYRNEMKYWSEMLYWIFPTAALCRTNQEQFLILDCKQYKSSAVWEVLEHGSDLLFTQVWPHTKRNRQDEAGWLPAEMAPIFSRRGTVQIAGPDLSRIDSSFRGTQFYWGKTPGTSKGSDDISLMSSLPSVSLAYIKITRSWE